MRNIFEEEYKFQIEEEEEEFIGTSIEKLSKKDVAKIFEYHPLQEPDPQFAFILRAPVVQLERKINHFMDRGGQI